jgi:peptidoglycan/xylan/chitin deacetylase (PgdA/CDA1 family)
MAGVGAPKAWAASYQPAFYTWQAPGGSATAGHKVIALTFDDGPGVYTPQVLSILESYHIPATFFEIGVQIAKDPAGTRLVASAGYPVENHTWSHPDLTTLSPSAVVSQVQQTQAEIQSLTGQTPTCVRPPYDAFNPTVLDTIGGLGLTTMSYSVDPRDWSQPGVAAIVSSVLRGASPGAVVDLHDGASAAQTVAALPQIISSLEAEGYGFVSICGSQVVPPPPPAHQASAVFGFGDAPPPGTSVTSNVPLVAVGRPVSGPGYWLAAADGGVFSFDGAGFFGSMGNKPLAKPIVGMAATADGKGYWLVASDGGIFSFGDARFFGSMGNKPLAKPIVGMAATADGQGYWLVASDGGLFAFGDAVFHGSMGNKPLTKPVVGMAATVDAKGYWLVASDGGIFSFGDAVFHGSAGALSLVQPVVGMAADAATGGYWLVAADGGTFDYGAPFLGSEGGSTTNKFFGMASTATGRGYLLAGEHPVPYALSSSRAGP